MIPMRKLLPVPHSQQRREGSTALLALLCGFSPPSYSLYGLPLSPSDQLLWLRTGVRAAFCARFEGPSFVG